MSLWLTGIYLLYHPRGCASLGGVAASEVNSYSERQSLSAHQAAEPQLLAVFCKKSIKCSLSYKLGKPVEIFNGAVDKFNSTVEIFNDLVDKFNRAVETFNEAVESFNRLP